ncbi:MAG: thioredoxin protein [Planctomycetota bacterium]|nr:thioredoxin protein [Planctomycetota bacterium]
MKRLKSALAALATLAALALVPLLGTVAHAESASPNAAASVRIPEPWKTATRMRVASPDDNLQVLGSGTVVYSTAERSVVLTCAHLFEGKYRTGTLTVDLFHPDMEWKLNTAGKLRFKETHPGRLLDINVVADVALVEIRPGRTLDASPVIPADASLKPGQSLTSVGCGGGKDATVWTTSVTQLGVAGPDRAAFTECTGTPKQGRSGGGLYTLDGVVVGVCDFARSDSNRGLYASPESIRAILAKNALTQTFDQITQCPPSGPCPQRRPGTAASPEPHFHGRPSPPPELVENTPDKPPTNPPPPPATASLSLSDLIEKADAALPEGSHYLALLGGAAALLLPKRQPATAVKLAA